MIVSDIYHLLTIRLIPVVNHYIIGRKQFMGGVVIGVCPVGPGRGEGEVTELT